MYQKQIEALLAEKIGLSAQSIGPQTIFRAVQERIVARGQENIERYLRLLQSDHDEIEELIENVVIHETWFFRDDEPWVFLKKWARENHAGEAKSAGPLKFLSLACSTGEEPFSIAMSMTDLGLAPSNYLIDAVDISKRAIDQARRGLFRAHSFRCRDL